MNPYETQELISLVSEIARALAKIVQKLEEIDAPLGDLVTKP